MDHPDIEQFVDWKVIEEQKVAAVVAGSKALNEHMNAIVKACLKPSAIEKTAELYNPKTNPA